MTVIPIKPDRLYTPEAVFEDATKNNVRHVMVVGITEDGKPYVEINSGATMEQIAWMLLSAEYAVKRALEF